MVLSPKNARGRPVTKLCLALEAFRRTPEGRARDAKAFLEHFFPHDPHGPHGPHGPHDKSGPTDKLFLHMPKEVRADLLSSWGIRGKKSALQDDDAKVRATIIDALEAGDIDAAEIEASVTPEILIDWVPLEDWWVFWRGAGLPAPSTRKALALARELSLFDERWFIENLKLGAKRLEGTDVICAALSKDQIVAWLHAVHTSGDASPAGLVTALGWDTILTKTAQEALAFALDALARQIGLAGDRGPAEPRSNAPKAVSQHPAAPSTPAKVEVAAIIAIPADLPPMRPPARTLSGVGEPAFFESMTAEVAVPSFDVPSEDPAWAPPHAEPGDMGWDIVYGVKVPMPNNVQPKYKFDDDEPTSEIDVPGVNRRA